jgi:antitoxin component YwqK of YwqJK toxin-antitoxin module
MKHITSLIIVFLLLNCTSCIEKPQFYTLDINNTNLVLDNGVMFYKGKPFYGVLEDYYDNDVKKTKVEYENGRKHGFELSWYSNKLVALERWYQNGVKVGVHKAYWDNGNAKFVYHFNNKGEYNGSVKEWYYTGEMVRDFNYVNGKENGSQKMWMQNGNIRANYEVINGERFGLIGLKKCYQVSTDSDKIK